jgi:hypothetical protein
VPVEIRQRREQALAAEVYIAADAAFSKFFKGRTFPEDARSDTLAVLVIKAFRQVGGWVGERDCGPYLVAIWPCPSCWYPHSTSRHVCSVASSPPPPHHHLIDLQLGFAPAAQKTFDVLPRAVQTNEETIRALNTEPVDVPGVDRVTRESSARFQMRCMGPDMPRDLGSTVDKRVPYFLPDQWQLQYVAGGGGGRRLAYVWNIDPC